MYAKLSRHRSKGPTTSKGFEINIQIFLSENQLVSDEHKFRAVKKTNRAKTVSELNYKRANGDQKKKKTVQECQSTRNINC